MGLFEMVFLSLAAACLILLVGLQVYQAGYDHGERDGWYARKRFGGKENS